MTTPILATKLYIPPPRPKAVPRPRLIERLKEGVAMGSKLTLISAPAGFGKITLVSEWIASCGMPVAWLSLDEGDSDSARFISYLVKALQTIRVGIGEGLLAALQSPQPPQIETVLTTLLNEISTIPENFLLVLDDYHSIDSRRSINPWLSLSNTNRHRCTWSSSAGKTRPCPWRGTRDCQRQLASRLKGNNPSHSE